MVSKEELRAWDIYCKEFVLVKGKYVFNLGSSSNDIKLTTQINLK